MKGYSNLFHVYILSCKYKIKSFEAAYLYGKLQYRISMISFEYVLKSYKKSLIENKVNDFRNECSYKFGIKI